MANGTIAVRPGALPNKSQAATISIPATELSLSEFGDIDAWMQPDQGNVLAASPNLQVFSRFGGHSFTAKGADIAVGTDMTNSVEVVSFAGGSPTGSAPLRASGLYLGGDYMLCGIFGFDADAVMSDVHTFFSSGIQGTTSAQHIYASDGALVVKHDALSHTEVGAFTAGNTYFSMICYEAATDTLKAYINSREAVHWDGTNATGVIGGDGDVTIGSRWQTGNGKAVQLLGGFCRAAWIGRAPWGAARYDGVRNEFMTRVASLYPDDITLA